MDTSNYLRTIKAKRTGEKQKGQVRSKSPEIC